MIEEKDAKKHQNKIDFIEGLYMLIDNNIGYHKNHQLIFYFISEHKKELLELLKLGVNID